MRNARVVLLILSALFLSSAVVVIAGGSRESSAGAEGVSQFREDRMSTERTTTGGSGRTETIVLGGGCFWCTEAVFEQVPGVREVISGYAGGTTENPTYYEVVSGRTGHAEVIRIVFDPEETGYEELYDMFFLAHDPTTLNRQGADVGTQYRSIILYQNDQEKATAVSAMERAQKELSEKIVTEIVPLTAFYPAEDYHQDYYAKNPFDGYCTFVIRPKLQKLELE